jgi:hypothetical protein
VDDALAFHPVAQAHLVEQVDGALLEDSGANALLHVLARAILEDHRLYPALVQQMPQNESGGACADDPDLGAQFACQRSGQSPLLIGAAYYLSYPPCLADRILRRFHHLVSPF